MDEIAPHKWLWGMAYPGPFTFSEEILAVLMSSSSPSTFSREPPLFPVFMATSV